MKICLFGHPAHEWSGSSRFFESILTSIGDMTYLRPNSLTVGDQLRWALENEFDLYVFFQFDFLAYGFIAAGHNVVIVPMVDGSASYGSEHWKYLTKGRFISFSRTLHNFLRIQGITSFAIQYWPEPKVYESPQHESIYYWPRGHHNYISTRAILDSTRLYPNLELRVRESSTQESILDYSRVSNPRLKVIGIDGQHEHLEEIRRSSIFVAPRPSEGIGQSFLEAMSYGRCVIARKFPTMSEYLVNRKTGVFLSATDKPIESRLDWNQIGRAAHSAVTKGYEEYLGTIPALSDFISRKSLKISRFRVKEINELIDLSCQIMRGKYFPTGNVRTLQNFANIVSIFKR